ncbi:MAG: hypothetical protein J0I43_13520 [Microbacterium sp.]|uniref:hypothetical protein n=1 Tax=Microbacterium sp. TaxID=51671 RepID=UPI001ACB98EA|nr:hypothetical protein [Microbacterium sp.]MBN9178368.1 hypothetical protein [Microbacterium sp.]
MAHGESGRALRALRGCAAAAIAVLIASTAHTLSGGEAPPFWLALAVTILAAPVCVALIGPRPGRARGLPRLGAAVVAAQLALHGAFAAVGDGAPSLASAGHHHAIDLGALVAGGQSVAAGMTLGHALAAVLTFVVLAWGERLVAIVARGIRQLLRRTLPALRPHRAVITSTGHVAPHLTSRLVHCASRRGPPQRLALALTA